MVLGQKEKKSQKTKSLELKIKAIREQRNKD